MGNGPSLAEVDFFSLKNVDTFGLNLAFREFSRIDWAPTYFGSFDMNTAQRHSDELEKYISSEDRISKFFFPNKISSDNRVVRVRIKKDPKLLATSFESFYTGGNSGIDACQAGLIMGYKKLIIVGVDADYNEILAESKQIKGYLKIDKKIDKNPNYWFNDYQRVGDIYNQPKANIFHIPMWKRFADKVSNIGVDIVNCSSKSKVNCFRRGDLIEELGS